MILLDVRMPGLDGFETAKHIRGRERSRHTPIIFLTAQAGDDFPVAEAYTLGAVDYLVKPLMPEIVRAKVTALVELFQEKERARRQAELLRLLIEGTSDYAIYMLDPQGRVATWNAAAERLHGYQSEEILGENYARFYPAEERDRGVPAAGLRRAEVEGRSEAVGWRLRKDNSRFWADAVLTPLRDTAGRLQGFSKVTRDLTERRRAEEEVRNHRDGLARANEILRAEVAERTRAEAQLRRTTEDLTRSNHDLEQFAYVASHDLQEPVRMVSLYVQLLQRKYRGKLDEQADQYIGRAVGGALHMQTLIRDLLAYARVGSKGKELVPVDCADVFEQAMTLLAAAVRESGAEVSRTDLPTVSGDATQLVQLFQNLIGNALKFRTDRVPQVRVEAVEKGPDWCFSVRDNGIGIEQRYVSRLFVIFQRLHNKEQYPGTGIGLAISKKVVERHGGRIWLESEPGHGTTVYFTLPKAGGQ